MSRPWLLDLYSCAGGAAMGYYRAGFNILGVDIAPQKHYPFAFQQGEALLFLDELIQSGAIGYFAAIHASPPCQHYTPIAKQFGNHLRHPDLVAATRTGLRRSGLPWIMENVVGAPFEHATVLCGSHFRLGVYRHRLFESSHILFAPGPCRHDFKPIGVYGETFWDSSKRSSQRKNGPRTGEWRPGRATKEEANRAMGIDWMTHKELSQAIPPAYTEYIGKQLLAMMGEKTA